MSAEFKVLWPYRREEIAELERLECPRRVPWSFVAPHEHQAKRNHDQTLERLNQRGGLDPVELVVVLEGKGLREVSAADLEASVLKLKSLLIEWTADSKDQEE